MQPWTIDAREAIRGISDLKNFRIERNNSIDNYLLNHDPIYFVIATKGLGKSLLLLLKRKMLHERTTNYLFIPKDILLDSPALSTASLGRDALLFLTNQHKLTVLWSISIALAIMKNLDLPLDKKASQCLKDIYDDKEDLRFTVSGYFEKIITVTDIKQFSKFLVKDYNMHLINTIRNINDGVAIFIDNVDECFEESIDNNIWYNVQNCLITSIYRIVRVNPKIKIFSSLRKEAFMKLGKRTPFYLQYKGVSLMLSYSKDELRKIFSSNIELEKDDKIMTPDRFTDPVYNYLGIDNIQHGHVNEQENIFDYIFRHTLMRPRDIMEMGREVSIHDKADRNPQTAGGLRTLKNVINSTATTIVNAYLQEILPHLSIEMDDINKICSLIDSNVLEQISIKTICMKFNGNDASCMSSDCKSCRNKKHIFCELYKIGLLGFVEENRNDRGKFNQRFLPVGEKIYDDIGLLPRSQQYLIHPIMDELIRDNNNKYRNNINSINIVGYDREWRFNQRVDDKSIQRPAIFISSTNDLKQIRDAIEEVIIGHKFSPIRSENINSPKSFNKCIKLSKECNFFVSILGKRYGEEFRRKSICEHEFEAAYKNNPNKIIVYILEGDLNRWDKKQRKFCDRIQNIDQLGYMRGGRVHTMNIKERFEKDLLEKIHIFSKNT